jgi:hypothetical protein
MMSILHKSASLAAVALVASMFAAPHFAMADAVRKPADQVVAASQKSNMDDKATAMKLSQEGFDTMRDVHAARLAIFNGEPKMATDMLARASIDLGAAQKDSVAYFAKGDGGFKPMKASTDVNHQAETRWIPIDGRMAIGEDFMVTPEKTAKIKKANEHLMKGDHAKAIDELKLGEIDVSFTRVMMPLDITVKHVNTAVQLAKDGKFYEANLALKAAEESIVMDTIALVETPKAPVN